MEHLENKHFIHRNLSAKSILVTDNEIVGTKDMYVMLEMYVCVSVEIVKLQYGKGTFANWNFPFFR